MRTTIHVSLLNTDAIEQSGFKTMGITVKYNKDNSHIEDVITALSEIVINGGAISTTAYWALTNSGVDIRNLLSSLNGASETEVTVNYNSIELRFSYRINM